jgi:hypothetical protein
LIVAVCPGRTTYADALPQKVRACADPNLWVPGWHLLAAANGALASASTVVAAAAIAARAMCLDR